ncbi:hypothetical protein F5887DRAFT_1068304 [Amanita rubescens]|nr:hypothetical protein F5887DRAFT_1068304 [Amanita rubescens]
MTGENQPPSEGTLTVPEASGSGSGGGGFNWDDIDTSHEGWGWIKTGNQDKSLQNKKRLSKLAHLAMILGSSKASGGKDLYYAPMTKGAAHHNDFVPEKSLDYLSGPKVDDKSKLLRRLLPAAHSGSEADLDSDAVHHLPSANNHRAVVAADQDHLCLLVPLIDTRDLDADAVEATAKVHLDAVAAEDNRSNCWLPTLASNDSWMSSS